LKLSKRANNIQPSATFAVAAKAKQMKSEGKPILSFSAGEPDFSSPRCACDAAIDAINRGETHYTPNSGLAELKKEVSGYYKARFGLDYPNSGIIVTSGAKQLIYEALQALVDAGDEVLLFAPAWVSYVEQVNLAEGVSVVVETEGTDFIPRIEEIEKKITARTIGMIINTPNNPTGVVYDAETLGALADIADRRGLWIIFDEIYERLVYGSARHSNILQVAPHIADRVIIANGVSKAYSMTGWRIGYALGPRGIISKMDDIQGHLTSNASSIAQWASIGAMRGAEREVEEHRAEFEKRRDLTYKLVSGVKGLRLKKPDGAFYALFDVRDTPLPDDAEFCQRLLEEKYVAMVPGKAFLAPGFVRMSYACSESNIIEGASRLKDFVESL
jgi:aspartate aminotransferase